MGDISEIVRLVQQKIEQREQTTTRVSVHDTDRLTEKTALGARKIIITDIYPTDLALLLSLSQTAPLVKFIQLAQADGDEVLLQIAFTNVNFIPWSLLVDWSLNFSLADERQLHVSKSHMISRRDVVNLTKKSVFIKRNDQQMTASAQEYLRDQQIEILERTDQLCIWQK